MIVQSLSRSSRVVCGDVTVNLCKVKVILRKIAIVETRDDNLGDGAIIILT